MTTSKLRRVLKTLALGYQGLHKIPAVMLGVTVAMLLALFDISLTVFGTHNPDLLPAQCFARGAYLSLYATFIAVVYHNGKAQESEQ